MMRTPNGPRRIAVMGGVYSNWLALQAALADARRRGAEEIYCLGDLGAFGPHPDRVWPLLVEGGVRTIQGNYEESLAAGAEDCNCGYTDPRDNHFAQISFDYTAAGTSDPFKRWMSNLPGALRLEMGGRRMLFSHGSPRRINEFLWETTTSSAFLERLLQESSADVILCTHTGLPWHRRLPGDRHLVNVGAIGRPPNDGRPEVVYALLETGAGLNVEFVRVAYDHHRLAGEMREERLPEEFVETIETGWWTTCLEILPAKERARGLY
jgi:diadenosine tetraphosphatase ApaH/serine/threonine PP2A family protein phosphatase